MYPTTRRRRIIRALSKATATVAWVAVATSALTLTEVPQQPPRTVSMERPTFSEQIAEFQRATAQIIDERRLAYADRIAAYDKSLDASDVDNDAIKAKRTALADAVAAAKDDDAFADLVVMTVFVLPGYDIEDLEEERAALLEAVDAVHSETIEKLDGLAAEIEAAVEAERERIRAEEEARRAAEEAERRRAASAFNRGSGARGGEDPYARVQRLMARLGVSVPFTIGSCTGSASAGGCYWSGSSQIIITPFGLTGSDCFVMQMITHEMRHMWQYRNGMWKIEGGVLVNRAELEADAYAYMYCV